MNKITIDFFIILALWILHLSFFSLFSAFTFINLPLLYILLRIAFNYQTNLWWLVIFIGLLNDMYSLYYFGTYLTLYLVIAWLSYIILYYFFTNRTLLSLGTGVITGSIVFKFIQLVLVYFGSSLTVSVLWLYMQNLFLSILFESFILVSLIIILNLFLYKKNV